MSNQQPKTQMNIEHELFNEKFQDDTTFSTISRDYIRLPMEKSFSFRNKVFEEVIRGRLIPLMKINHDFARYFKEASFGGSSGKDIKVGYPNDYDLNMMFEFIISYVTKKVEPYYWNDSFIKIDVKFDSSSRDGIFFQRLMDGYYLDQDKFYDWICRVCSRAIKRYREKYDQQDYKITANKTDTDFNIDIKSNKDGDIISIRVVPCLIFYDKSLQEFRKSKHEWSAVSIRLPDDVKDSNILWRPSFDKDEKEILNGHIKPLIRMFKKLRDSMKWTDLQSYFIETLFMYELDNEKFKNNYEQASRTAIFIYMLKRLREVLKNNRLLYYWNQNINLCASKDRQDMLKVANELDDLICTIENEIEDDPEILLNYFSNSDDDSDSSYDNSSESHDDLDNSQDDFSGSHDESDNSQDNFSGSHDDSDNSYDDSSESDDYYSSSESEMTQRKKLKVQ